MPVSPVEQRSHATKPSAHRSASLRHASSAEIEYHFARPAEASSRKIGGDESGPRALAIKQLPSKEGKGSGDSGAGHGRTWFDRSNENPGERFGQIIVDNDPPFFQPDQSSSSDDQMGDSGPHFRTGVQGPYGFMQQETNGTSVDDFRSVIDDLTVENKQLRARLRKHEKSHSAPLEKDKLFEVKVHGLSPRQKRQLEETLRTFASGLVTNNSTTANPSDDPLKGRRNTYNSVLPKSVNEFSSATSEARAIDSGYASMSTTGPNTAYANNHVTNQISTGAPSAKTKVQKVQSFLDDIPEGLLPKHPTIMPERTKKKIVVKRLEQLFTGNRELLKRDHSHALQQQEVSNLAAHDDHEAVTSKGIEGAREANILEFEMELDKIKLPKLQTTSNCDSADERGGSRSETHKQRPTRPLDLDPDRTQVPSENMEYIRHLGILASELPVMGSTDVAADADGWIYLNLLVNMAQLHIINVTPSFVRSAVTEFSSKLQLSPGGDKLRWRGGTEGTLFSSSDSAADSVRREPANDSESFQEVNRKRRKVGDITFQSMTIEQGLQSGHFSSVPVADHGHHRSVSATDLRNTFHYNPLFRRKTSIDSDAMSIAESVTTRSYLDYETGDAGRVTRSNESLKSPREGPIVFYSGAPFCTDLSADRNNISTPLHAMDVGKDGFSNHTHDALGCHAPMDPPGPTRTLSGSALQFRPFKDYSVFTHSAEDEAASSGNELKILESASDVMEFSPKWTAVDLEQQVSPIDLEACGLGGSRPADHFAITVETSRPVVDRNTRSQLSKFSVKRSKVSKNLRSISQSSIDAFHVPEGNIMNRFGALRAQFPLTLATNRDLPVKAKLLSARVRRLMPSQLPPPVNYYAAFSSSSGSTCETTLEDNFDKNRTVPVYQSHPIRSPHDDDPMDEDGSNHSDDTDDEGDDYASDEDSSIDMLALARASDPATVAALERQFAPTEPSESSKATAGRKSTVSNASTSSFGSNDL